MAMKLEAGEVGRLDLFTIFPHEIIVDETKNGRRHPHEQADIEEMCASYEYIPKGETLPQGQQTPVVVRRIEGNRVKLVLGYRRLRGAELYNLKHPDAPMKLKCQAVIINDEEAFRRNVVENKDRKGVTPIDDAYNQRRFREEFAWTDKAIAEFYRCSEGYVGQLKLVPGLPEEVQEMIRLKQLSVKAGIELMDVSDDDKTRIIAEVKAEGKVTSGAVMKKVRDKKLDTGGTSTLTARSMKEIRGYLEGLRDSDNAAVVAIAEALLKFIRGGIKDETMTKKLLEALATAAEAKAA